MANGNTHAYQGNARETSKTNRIMSALQFELLVRERVYH
jgi:hypothetical protein